MMYGFRFITIQAYFTAAKDRLHLYTHRGGVKILPKLDWKNKADEQLPHNVKRYFSMIKKILTLKKNTQEQCEGGRVTQPHAVTVEIEWLLMSSVCRNSGLRSDFHFLYLQSAPMNIVSNSNEAQSNEVESHRQFFLLLSVSACHLAACFTGVMMHFSATVMPFVPLLLASYKNVNKISCSLISCSSANLRVIKKVNKVDEY